MENKKSLIALALVALVGVVGATFAYFTSSTTLTNEFETGTYSTSVTEEFVSPDNWTPGTTTQKKVNVTNNGSVDVAVRAKYTETWTAKDGTALSGTRNGEKVAQFIIGSDWEKATDGYYYYKGTLTNGQTSSDFISSVTFNPTFELKEGTDIECTTTKENGKTTVSCANLDNGYAGATYSLDITIETIQADQKWPYTAACKWIYTDSDNSGSITIGDEYAFCEETFNVIKDNGDTVTMLAQYNLGTDYKQSETENDVMFSNDKGWEYTPGPKEIDIQLYDGDAKTYVNNYVAYLKGETGDSTLSGTLITVAELGDLGCTVPSDYTDMEEATCANSENAEWLVNGQSWWTRSAYADFLNHVWYVDAVGGLDNYYSFSYGVRPVITISKSAI